MTQTSVKVLIEHLGPGEWNALNVQSKAGWTKNENIYAYLESVPECILLHRPIGEVCARIAGEAAGMLEGRIFDENREVRWIRRQDGQFEAWLTREDPNGSIDAEPARRRYYLIGTYRSGESAFREARYPGRSFPYPKPPEGAPQDEDRAWIEVVEYAPAQPDWTNMTERQIAAAFDQPLVVAHRFTGFGVGRDSGGGGGEKCHPRSA
jgi:hypothetical protein